MFRRHKKPAKEGPPPVHHVVGTIVSINEAQNYALIDTGGTVSVNKGEALKSFSGDQQTAILTVSPEQRPPFMIADIISGTPHNGDQVMK